MSAVVIVGAAGRNTEAATTARVTFAYTLRGQSIATSGIADVANGQGTYTTHIPGVGSIEAIQNGTVLYEKLPAQLLPGSKPWIKFDAALAMHRLTGIDPQSLSQSVSTNPASTLDYLEGISRDTRKIGSDVLRGAATTHYRGTVDLAVAASKATDPHRKTGLDQLRKLLGVGTFPIDVWIDSDGRLRKMNYALDVSKFNETSAGASKLTGTATYMFEFFDFGVPFAMPKLPDPKQVNDINSALPGPTDLVAPTPSSSGKPLATILAPLPNGFAQSTLPDDQNGPIDAASFAALIGSKATAAKLHFTTGYEETVDGSTTYETYQMSLFQFDSPVDAATFDRLAVTALASHHMTATQDTQLPAAWTLDSQKQHVASNFYEHEVIARRQNRVMILDFTNRIAGTTPPLAVLLARQQYARL
jgi:hypothetical protein